MFEKFQYGLRFFLLTKDWNLSKKEKFFDTAEDRDDFANKIAENDNFAGFDAWLSPQLESRAVVSLYVKNIIDEAEHSATTRFNYDSGGGGGGSGGGGGGGDYFGDDYGYDHYGYDIDFDGDSDGGDGDGGDSGGN